MAKILINGDLAHHPLVLSIPRSQRAAALGLWIRAGAWLAGQRAAGHVHVGSSTIPAAVVRDLCGPGGHHSAWALVHGNLWLEATDLRAKPSTATMPAAPDGADPRTWCRTTEYLMRHGHPGPGALWRIELRSRRVPIPESVRTAVYLRDGQACVTCGTSSDLTLDHIVPWARGGSDTPANLQTMCRSCNSRKGARV